MAPRLFSSVCALGALSSAGCDRTFEHACGDLAEAECGRLAACSSTLLASVHGDLGTCERNVAARCERLAGMPGVEIGSGDIAACAAAYGDHPCESFLSGARPRACSFTGNKPNGEVCAAGAECQSSHCKPAVDSGCGECGAVRNEYEPCSKAGSPCAAGLYCSTAGRCIPFGVPGDPCSAVALCNPLYWCKDGACALPLGEGESCADGASCDRLRGLECAASGVCEPSDASIIAAEGAPACD